MSNNNRKVIISVIYRSPSQTNDKSEAFFSNFQMVLNDIINRKPSLSVINGDFNSRCSSWWSDDINTKDGLKLFTLTSSNGFSQLINEPTHIQASSSSCISLTFIDQVNLSVTQVSMNLSIRTGIIILFTLALTLIFTIPHHTNV